MHFVILGGIQMYSRTPVTQTLKEKEKQFKLEEVPVIEVDWIFNLLCK